MQKLSLDVDDLAVESFPTEAPTPVEEGTVHAQMATQHCVSRFTSCRADMRDACTCPV
ncbi:MAG TPA: hypothetical protein VF092_03605 [Longimicrobium sp.]